MYQDKGRRLGPLRISTRTSGRTLARPPQRLKGFSKSLPAPVFGCGRR